jgi:methionyl aminopeptidase
MINIRSEEEILRIRESSLLVAKTLAEVARHITPGVSLLRLDQIAEDFIRSYGGRPAFKGYNGFTGSLCLSRNEEVVHGIPTSKVLEDGDIVSVDCGVEKAGYYGDSAYTFAVGNVKLETLNLLSVTKESLLKGIEQAKAGNRIGDIGQAVQQHAQKHGYGVVRELVGHGIGTSLHEKPEVPNYGKRGSGVLLKPGMVLAIEPMINMGTKDVRMLSDGWTITTRDNKPSAHFEHTVVVRENHAEVLSTFQWIEEILNKPQ